MRPLCHKALVENSGEGTSTVTSREENPQVNTNDVKNTVDVLKKIASHSCFMISKRNKMRRNGERKDSRFQLSASRNKFAKRVREHKNFLYM